MARTAISKPTSPLKPNALDVPCGPILDTSDRIDDEHLKVHDMIIEAPHPPRGTFKTVGSPLKLSDSPVEIFSFPLLGEHTEEVLREVMGYDKDKIEQLRRGLFSRGDRPCEVECFCPGASEAWSLQGKEQEGSCHTYTLSNG